VWFSGNSYPAPIIPYEGQLTAFLNNGGRLLMSGQDILDQGAGTTAFVHDYLHIDWDGTESAERQGDHRRPRRGGNPVSDGIGAVPLDHIVLKAAFEDKITPINGAMTAFTDDATDADALSFASTYKVVFLAFPLEAYGSGAQKADLMHRTFTFFGPKTGAKTARIGRAAPGRPFALWAEVRVAGSSGTMQGMKLLVTPRRVDRPRPSGAGGDHSEPRASRSDISPFTVHGTGFASSEQVLGLGHVNAERAHMVKSNAAGTFTTTFTGSRSRVHGVHDSSARSARRTP
jgi:hypothetical protein